MRIPILVVLLMSASAAARAQSTKPVIFAEGAVIGDSHSFDRRSSHMVPGGSATIGVQLTRYLSVRFDTEIPAMHTRTTTESFLPVARYTETESFRAVSYAILFGGHIQAGKRLNVALLAGASDARLEASYSYSTEVIRPPGTAVVVNQFSDHDSEHVSAIALGADVTVNITRHLAVVPELRVQAFAEYGHAVRPKVAVRWTF